jgi:hypothetical protein
LQEPFGSFFIDRVPVDFDECVLGSAFGFIYFELIYPRPGISQFLRRRIVELSNTTSIDMQLLGKIILATRWHHAMALMPHVGLPFVA